MKAVLSTTTVFKARIDTLLNVCSNSSEAVA